MNRSVVSVESLPSGSSNEIRVLVTCDCGTRTDLTVAMAGPGSGGEGAFTCRCGTSHWFTVTARTDRDETP